MTAHYIINGRIQLVLTPSNEMERAILEQLCQVPVDMTMYQTLQIGTESVNDSVVITPQIKQKV